ncbi:SDR family oxidoreductase [Candidatus Poriferisocius sp.]|uniref:SDR family oxidoreductase n=1 Tax=Candidatus Poriferisocius sp. TaxID=3101276 RepID=UPI003B02BBD2
MSGRLAGRVAAITGASSGIGRAAAERFVEEGAEVVLGDIQDDAGRALAESLGDGAVFARCDVTSEDDVAGLVDTAVDRFGHLDIMYNNAGIVGAVGPIDTTPTDEWHASIDILLHGVFYGVKHAARVMKPRMVGSIISMASTAGVMGGLGPHAYATAKHAVVGLTKNAAAELCRFGIRVNCIAPASVLTPMVAFAHTGDHTNMDGARAELAANSPLIGRPGLATDVANAALWLASEESGYTSGHCLTTDAGYTTGARPDAPGFADYAPMIREAGRIGL